MCDINNHCVCARNYKGLNCNIKTREEEGSSSDFISDINPLVKDYNIEPEGQRNSDATKEFVKSKEEEFENKSEDDKEEEKEKEKDKEKEKEKKDTIKKE